MGLVSWSKTEVTLHRHKIPPPPYCPDLTVSDLHVYDKLIKKRLGVRRFSSENTFKVEAAEWLRRKEVSYSQGLENLIDR